MSLQQFVVSILCYICKGIFTCLMLLLTGVIPIVTRKKLPTMSYVITYSDRNFQCKNFLTCAFLLDIGIPFAHDRSTAITTVAIEVIAIV
jgi:hypothetical protein